MYRVLSDFTYSDVLSFFDGITIPQKHLHTFSWYFLFQKNEGNSSDKNYHDVLNLVLTIM